MKSALGIIRKYYPKVTSVVDAKKTIDIEVCDADIKSSRKKSPTGCAMAKAFCRTFDGAIISIGVAYLIRGKKATRYLVPGSVSRELVSFDRHHDFAPGLYYLSPPKKSSKLGPRRGRQLPSHLKKKKKYPKSKPRSRRTAGIRAL